jgi:anti-sigma factor RsiW
MTSLPHAENDPADQNPLAACVEDRLDDLEKERLIEHLAACGECRRTLAALARGRTSFRALQQHGPSVPPRTPAEPNSPCNKT